MGVSENDVAEGIVFTMEMLLLQSSFMFYLHNSKTIKRLYISTSQLCSSKMRITKLFCYDQRCSEKTHVADWEVYT